MTRFQPYNYLNGLKRKAAQMPSVLPEWCYRGLCVWKTPFTVSVPYHCRKLHWKYWQEMWFPGRDWPSQVWACFHGTGQGHHWQQGISPAGFMLFLLTVDVPWGQVLGNGTKGLSSLPVICTEDTGRKEWQREGEGTSRCEVCWQLLIISGKSQLLLKIKSIIPRLLLLQLN